MDQVLRFKDYSTPPADAMNTRYGLSGDCRSACCGGTVVVLADDEVVTGAGQAGHVGQVEVTSGVGVRSLLT